VFVLFGAVELRGLGGVPNLSPFPSSIWTTIFMEGRSTGFHWIHHSPTMASFFAISASPSSSMWNRRSSPSSKRL